MGDVRKYLVFVFVWGMSLATSLMVVPWLLWLRWKVGKEVFSVKPRPTPPPALKDSKWGSLTHTYMDLKTQGVKLHYVEAGDHNNPLMVFLHGFPECWFSWRHQLKYFSENYWVVAVDLRGYGDSDKPSGTSQYKKDLLVADLKHFIQGLGKEQCTLVAHDWGAVLAWHLVALYPHMFSAHISCNGPHPNSFEKRIKSSLSQLAKSWYIFLFQMPWLPELLIRTQDLKAFEDMLRGNKKECVITDDEIEVYKYYFSQKGALTPPINYYRNIDFGSTGKPLPRVLVPTLIIWGTGDVALDKELAVMGVDECESAEVKYVEGANHWVPQDEPSAFNTLAEQYLNSPLAGQKVL